MFLSVSFYTAFVASEMIMFFLVIDQLIAVKFIFNEHIISYFKYYLYGIWIVVILAAISFASVIPNHHITCSLLVISEYCSFAKLFLIGIVLICTDVSVAVLSVKYGIITTHVTASNKRVKNSKSTLNKRSIIIRGIFITTIGTSTWWLMFLLCIYFLIYSNLQYRISILISIIEHSPEGMNTSIQFNQIKTVKRNAKKYFRKL